MYDHTSHRGFKHFCYYRLQVFSTKEILKSYAKNCFNINGKQRIIIPKKGEYVKFKHYERKIKKPFKIYADCKSILVPEDNGKKIEKRFIETNIINILLAVIDTNQYVLMINLVSRSRQA